MFSSCNLLVTLVDLILYAYSISYRKPVAITPENKQYVSRACKTCLTSVQANNYKAFFLIWMFTNKKDIHVIKINEYPNISY